MPRVFPIPVGGEVQVGEEALTMRIVPDAAMRERDLRLELTAKARQYLFLLHWLAETAKIERRVFGVDF